MAYRHVTVPVVVEPIEWDQGHWCRRCLLPSGIRMWVVVRISDRMALRQRVWCDQCGSSQVTVRHVDEPA